MRWREGRGFGSLVDEVLSRTADSTASKEQKELINYNVLAFIILYVLYFCWLWQEISMALIPLPLTFHIIDTNTDKNSNISKNTTNEPNDHFDTLNLGN